VFVKRFSDNGELSGDIRAEKVGKVANVGRPAIVAVLEELEDAFWRAVVVPGPTADSSRMT
jgi:hypothetical protein